MQKGDLVEHTFRYVGSAQDVLQEKEVFIIEADEGDLVVLRPLNPRSPRIYTDTDTIKLPKEYLIKNAKVINGNTKI